MVWGAVLTQGTQFGNIGRQVALRAGCRSTVVGHDHRPPMLVGPDGDRHRRQADHHRPHGHRRRGRPGQRSRMVQTPEMRIAPDPSLMAMHKHVYMPMLQTAETVAQRYGIPRDTQDEYALRSQQRTAAAQAAGRFDDEIVPVTTTMMVKDKETGEVSQKEITIAKDEGNRADTTLEGLRASSRCSAPTPRSPPATPASCRDGSSACDPDGSQGGRAPRHRAAGPLRRHGGRGHRARRNGHRPDLRGHQVARPLRPQARRHRPVGIERGVRGAGDVLRASSSAFPRTGSTSTAARSRSATPMA